MDTDAVSQRPDALDTQDLDVVMKGTTDPTGAGKWLLLYVLISGLCPIGSFITVTSDGVMDIGVAKDRTRTQCKPSLRFLQHLQRTQETILLPCTWTKIIIDKRIKETKIIAEIYVKGLFRLLDLYSEQGSGSLVDKVIIAQDSLKSLIDTLSPGAYTSITKINFAALDGVQIKAIGLYGSKSEIVRVFRAADAVDEETADLLLLSEDDRKAHQLSLRSGIYLFLPPGGMIDLDCGFTSTVYVIYWPEDTTWDDTASGGVKKNRVTFMRYLTPLTGQIRIVASPEHAAALVWKEGDSNSDIEDEMG
ncbi:hypothetical protein FRB94_013305 [Tulasnella sp. JGI-2019a]|nr:hypothetical protein FRB93_006356 [Tulasnella sp. JGI-2019a]KAG8990536.1 hypothetical protein FRB94_013305 [Tulasnella sp. JGI-2019a]